MKAKVRVIIDDPLVEGEFGLTPENVLSGEEPFFLNGPIAERVAVIDRDPQTGQLNPPVEWSSASEMYLTPQDISCPQGVAVSVFGLVLETLEMFERKDVLGHKVKWAFDSPQLLVVPNAGIWQNAFYDRYSRSLQYFSFVDKNNNKTIHTALSRDIVTHETGHAILDGLAPALYDALTPQSLALHEAIGDLTAIVMSLQSRRVRDWIIRECGGQLLGESSISRLADQFGRAIGLERGLRCANDPVTLKDVSGEPHDLSRVLTGAFWASMVKIHNSRVDKNNQITDLSKRAPIDKILAVSALHIGRMLFRALDYLVPAEATFADYCRAVLRADQVGHLKDINGYRKIFQDEFISRGIVDNDGELECKPEEEWVKVNLDDILESEWAAFAFVEKTRVLLKIPPKIPFRLFPRRDVMRRYHLGPNQFEDRREVVLQVTWEEQEENNGISGVPRRRAVFHGTTLVLGGISNEKGQYPVLSCLTTDRSDGQQKARNNTILELVRRGQLEMGNKWLSFNCRPLEPKVFGRVTDNTIRLRGTARLIQLTELRS